MIVVGALALLTTVVWAQRTDDDAPHRQAARAEALVFDGAHLTFDDGYQRDVVERLYRFENTSDKIVRVLETVVVSGTAELTVEPMVLPPGAEGVVTLRQSLGDRLGSTAFRYAVVTDEAGGARYRFTLSGFVQSAYDPETPLLEFGVVDRTSGGSAEVEVFSREVERLQLQGVVDAADFIQVTEPGRVGVAGEGAVVLASLSPEAPEGYISGTITLKTNVANQPEVLVRWRAIVAGAVVPAENPINLGMAEIGYELQKEVRLLSRNGEPFTVDRVEADDAFRFTDGPCADVADLADDLCRSVMLAWTPEGRQRLGGSIRVWLLGQDGPITIRYRGLAVPPGTEVKELNPAGVWGDGDS